MKRINIHNRYAMIAAITQAFGGGLFSRAGQIPVGRIVHASDRSYARHIGATSRYKPHQGKRECARRVRQGVNHG